MGIEQFGSNRVNDVKQSLNTLKNTPATSWLGQIPAEMLKISSKSVFDIMRMFTVGTLKAAGTTARIAGKAVLASIPIPVPRSGEKVTALHALKQLSPRAIENRLEGPRGIKEMFRIRTNQADGAATDLNSLPSTSPSRSKIVGSSSDESSLPLPGTERV